jgi:hypothetical protein
MNTIEFFEQNKYVHLQNFLPKTSCDELIDELHRLISEKKTVNDDQCPKSQGVHGELVFDKLLEYCLPYFEKACGKQLYPTYSYARLYDTQTEVLEVHVDREACEISATITLGFDGNVWSIYMGDNKDKTNPTKIDMGIGDAVLYKGLEKWHWRESYFEGNWQAQVFLHYVDANGIYADWKYDKRESLGISRTETNKEKCFESGYTIPNAVSEQFCDNIIAEYSKKEVKKELPYIGDGEKNLNLDIRNVQRLPLPMNQGIGATLTSLGLNLNNQFWKYSITHSNQTEFLMYEIDGKYEAHTDTVHKHSNECRKLTVLAILNDDFEGGKFFIQNGHEKFYPKQSKGDVIVFPSFMLHGVEPVTKGIRYTVVTWMVGDYFK